MNSSGCCDNWVDGVGLENNLGGDGGSHRAGKTAVSYVSRMLELDQGVAALPQPGELYNF